MPVAESWGQNHEAVNNNNNATGFSYDQRSPCLLVILTTVHGTVHCSGGNPQSSSYKISENQMTATDSNAISAKLKHT